ncbi:MAG: PDGLE domain-containing protein [Phycisphaerae bacterium]|nr:PDGLE domain-containing protein [Phycisphaerae bacterium]
MHIPDGFLDTKTAVATGVIAAAGLGFALRQAREHLPPKRVPLLGLSAAFVFAAQMLNFPVAGGTSGHLVGAVLTAVLLGPSAAVIVISAVLIVQCLMFADGGISALGANVFNMAMVAGVGGWAIYYLVSRAFKGLFGRVLAAAFSAWCGTVLASIACAGELVASHTVGWSVALPAMAGVHALIGIGEGIITALVLVAVAQARPELIVEPTGAASSRSYAAVVCYGVLIALGLALFISPFASESPDGLDMTAEKLGFDGKANVVTPAPMPEYKIERMSAGRLGTSLAGAAGTVVVFVFSWLLARALVPRTGAVEVADPPGPE